MTYLDIVLIVLIEALAGTLPLSAGGHLALLSGLAADPGGFVAVSSAAQMGMAVGLAAWLWRDCGAMTAGLFRLLKGKNDQGGRLLLVLVTATLLPALLSWWLLGLVEVPHQQMLAAGCLTAFGILLALADRWGVTVRRIEHLGYMGAICIGLLQMLALLPGVSRTGITVTAARLMGFERRDAARLSLLLAIPLLAGHAVYGLRQLPHGLQVALSADGILAAGLAAVIAWLAAGGMLLWLNRHSYLPFCLWRIMLGAGVIVLFFLSA